MAARGHFGFLAVPNFACIKFSQSSMGAYNQPSCMQTLLARGWSWRPGSHWSSPRGSRWSKWRESFAKMKAAAEIEKAMKVYIQQVYPALPAWAGSFLDEISELKRSLAASDVSFKSSLSPRTDFFETRTCHYSHTLSWLGLIIIV